jgi:dTDP-L-rhamnose 4-epimerase
MGKKILVTGGAGFIGSFLVDRLIEKGHEVRIFDNLEPQVHHGKIPGYLNREAEFICGDVRDYDAFKKALDRIEVVFHEAAIVGVGQSQYAVKKYIDVNTGGTANLWDILVNHKNSVEKVMVAASMSSYGEGQYRCERCGEVRPNLRPDSQLLEKEWEMVCPYCKTIAKPVGTGEGAVQYCNSIYALTKKDQEEMTITLGKVYKIPSVALRYFNVYGPRQSLSNPYTGVAAIFMSRVKNNHPPVIYEDGLQSRDFVSVHDIVEANIIAMEKEEANYQVFNVGTGSSVSIKEVAEVIIKLNGNGISPDITGQFRQGDIRHCFSSIEKINKELGYEPRVDFKGGMKELFKWSEGEDSVDYFEKANRELKEKGIL